MIAFMRRITTRITTDAELARTVTEEAKTPRSADLQSRSVEVKNTTRTTRRRPNAPKLARGQGSTFYDPRDGRCVLEHRVVVDGKAKVFRERGESWPEVEDLRDLRRAEVARTNSLAGDGSTTVVVAYRDWLEYEAPESARGGGPIAPGTLRNHRETLRELETHKIGAMLLLDLRTRDVEAWLLELSLRRHGSTSLRDVRSRLRRSIDRAVRLELVETNPVTAARIPAKARRKKKPTWLDREGFLAVREELGRPDASTSERALLVTLLTGCRPGEVLGLRWDAVDFDARRIEVRSGLQVQENGRTRKVVDTLKTDASRRSVEMTADLVVALERERAEQRVRRMASREWIDSSLVFTTRFGKSVNPSNLRRSAREVCESLDIPAVTPNQLRHTFASVMLDVGLSQPAVARAMGHTDTRMVSTTYGHALDEVVPTAAAFDALRSVV